MPPPKHQFIHRIIPHRTPKQVGQGDANVNIALAKYWGKRDIELNLPTNSSLSISLPGLGTKTTLQWIESSQDTVTLNNQPCTPQQPFATRISQFLDPFRPNPQGGFDIKTHNSVPTAAGLASSASGYAALVLALNDCFQWQLDPKSLSLLARLGSGSASRSIDTGFVMWHQGRQPDGMDSFAEKIDQAWPNLNIGLLEIDLSEKPIGSTQGMQQTVNHCDLYQAWPEKAETDFKTLQTAISQQDFTLLGTTAENNALSMHATMLATWPPICYFQPDSIQAMQQVWQLRAQGTEVYFTMDAGPNLKLLFLEKDQQQLQSSFPHLKIIQPFNEDYKKPTSQ